MFTVATIVDSEQVLIAPLWNWNSRLISQSRTEQSSNRTFMELKYHYSYQTESAQEGSNRTFMELKSNRSKDELEQMEF